jgi:transcriptional regulator with XRE-family HTH domain
MQNRIDVVRKKKNMSYAEIAAVCGFTAQYVWALAKGKRTNPSADAMQKIAKALGENVIRIFPL